MSYFLIGAYSSSSFGDRFDHRVKAGRGGLNYRGQTYTILKVFRGLIGLLSRVLINLSWGALCGVNERFLGGIGNIVSGWLVSGLFRFTITRTISGRFLDFIVRFSGNFHHGLL